MRPSTTWNDELIPIFANVKVYASGDSSFQWSQTAGPGVVMMDASIDGVVIDASALKEGGQVSLSLSVTDSNNKTTTDTMSLQLEDKITTAMGSGDASAVTHLAPQIVERALSHIEKYRLEVDSSAFSDEWLWLNLFESGDVDFNLANCATRCDSIFTYQYQRALERIRAWVRSFDGAKIDIFSQPDYSLYKLYKFMVLLGDVYRHSIQYPMDVSTTNSARFLEAYYADHSVYNYRNFNLIPNDLGNFSRTNFGHVIPVDESISLMSKKGFRSAGVYALPGQTVHISRSDDSNVRVGIFINTQRPASTHEFGKNEYIRPKYLQSRLVELRAGESIKLTSPYGGPMQVKFDQSDKPVELRFKNVGLHPHWRDGKDGNRFLQDLAADQYDWAELATEHFEVHSRAGRMRTTMASEPLWDTPEKMGEAIMTYIHNYPHLLAGYKGPYIDEVSEIVDFAERQGWDVHTINTVKHMNADQSVVSYGAAGNPYDANWHFRPLHHGDLHELGHGLEDYWLRFDNHELHASTNPYSYYSKSRAYSELGIDPSCQSVSVNDLFDRLQTSARQPDPFSYMRGANLSDWESGMAIMLQMMIAAQQYGALENGWHLLARVHILIREFNSALASNELWQQKRSQLGFSQFSRSSVVWQKLPRNDFLLIAMSYSAGLDYRELYQMWGLVTSEAAKNQVGLFNYPVVDRQVYVYAPGSFCFGLNLPSVPVDGAQNWPLE